jgi:2,3-bisphosphoglycerate-independent phosphoglycerate mutase
MLTYHDLMKDLHVKNDSKIVMLVADGLGGLPMQPGGPTELEAANTAHLDALVADGVCGLSVPVLPGIAPGSGPGHLGLFGYDPLRFLIGRGALEATGIGLELRDQDVAVRGNFCTLDSEGKISDRRAGRIASEESFKVVEKLAQVKLPGIEVIVRPVKEHRFVLVLRGPGLGGNVRDTDPQQTGVPPLAAVGDDEASRKTADLANQFVEQARKLIQDEPKANGLTLRGFSAKPAIPSYGDLYGLRAAAIAVYPMYKGLASLVGMDIVGEAKDLQEQVDVLKQAWNDYDFFFLHFKYTDAAGEDGDFQAKVRRIEEFDAIIPAVRQLNPTVTIVTGDHSTPAFLSSHSWHPVPTLLHSACCRPDACTSFGESQCLQGGLGQFQAQYLMGMAMANAGRLTKFGA